MVEYTQRACLLACLLAPRHATRVDSVSDERVKPGTLRNATATPDAADALVLTCSPVRDAFWARDRDQCVVVAAPLLGF